MTKYTRFTNITILMIAGILNCTTSRNKLRQANDQLLESVLAGEKSGTQTALANGALVDATNSGTWKTPLMIASEQGNIEIVQLLLKNKANLNIKDASGSTALSAAISKGNIQIAKLLLANGASANTIDRAGFSPITLASERDGVDFLELLLKAGAPIESKTTNGDTVLLRRIRTTNGDLDSVKYLIEHGARVDATNNIGETALMIAANTCQPEIVNFLLTKQIDVNATTNTGYTALMYVASKSEREECMWNSKIAQMLIKSGSDVNFQNNNGLTALILNKQNRGSADIQELLRSSGSNVAELSLNDNLLNAVIAGNTSEVSKLLKGGASTNSTNPNEQTLLMIACEKQYLEIAKLLIANKADINATDGSGWTALHYSIYPTPNIKIVQMLIDNEIDVNTRSNNHFSNSAGSVKANGIINWSALMLAVKSGNMAVVKLLLNSGADVNVQADGDTAINIAERHGHKEISNLLKRSGAKGVPAAPTVKNNSRSRK